MNTRVKALITLPVLVGAVGQARAQDAAITTAEPKFSARLGGTALTDGNTKSVTGRGGFLGALGMRTGTFGRTEVEFARTSSAARIKTLGLSYTHQFPLNKTEFGSTGTGAYGGLGLGVYRVSADSNGGSGIAAFDTSGTRLGGTVLVGYQFQNRYFVEAGYTKIGSVRGADPSRFSASLGIKF